MPFQVSPQRHQQGNIRRLLAVRRGERVHHEVGKRGDQFVAPSVDLFAMIVPGNGGANDAGVEILPKHAQQSLRALVRLIIGINVQGYRGRRNARRFSASRMVLWSRRSLFMCRTEADGRSG